MSETPQTVLTLADEIAETKARQQELFRSAEERVTQLLLEAAALCAFVGARTRDQVPKGLLKRRARATKPQKSVARARRSPAEVPVAS